MRTHRLRPALVAAVLALAMGLPLAAAAASDAPPDARELVRKAFDYMRGRASVSEVDMTIHRADWERTMTIQAWTRGLKQSLFYISAPAKDAGNGSLKDGHQMWTYNPKVNRVIKLPPSMMAQAWMGSDFSNNDLSKSDSLIEDYDHRIDRVETIDGRQVFFITATPRPEAPVVWGMQKLSIREDGIFLEEAFFDEDLAPVKTMTTHEIADLGGRPYPRRWRMQDAEDAEKYTLLEYRHLEFKEDLPERLFTRAALKRPPAR